MDVLFICSAVGTLPDAMVETCEWPKSGRGGEHDPLVEQQAPRVSNRIEGFGALTSWSSNRPNCRVPRLLRWALWTAVSDETRE